MRREFLQHFALVQFFLQVGVWVVLVIVVFKSIIDELCFSGFNLVRRRGDVTYLRLPRPPRPPHPTRRLHGLQHPNTSPLCDWVFAKDSTLSETLVQRLGRTFVRRRLKGRVEGRPGCCSPFRKCILEEQLKSLPGERQSRGLFQHRRHSQNREKVVGEREPPNRSAVEYKSAWARANLNPG